MRSMNEGVSRPFVAPSDYGMVAKARAGLYRFPCIMIAQAMRASLLA